VAEQLQGHGQRFGGVDVVVHDHKLRARAGFHGGNAGIGKGEDRCRALGKRKAVDETASLARAVASRLHRSPVKLNKLLDKRQSNA
jgi:hypothetical protein